MNQDTTQAPVAPIFWITGLSGAGKSTVAALLAEQIRISGQPCMLLDGDGLRELWPGKGGFTRPERLELGLGYARLCAMISRNGIPVVIATIALYREVHAWLAEHAPQTRLIWLDVPLDELRRRDPKGIYARYDAGETSYVAGLDLAVDWPERPWLHIEWNRELTPQTTLERIWPKAAAVLQHFPVANH